MRSNEKWMARIAIAGALTLGCDAHRSLDGDDGGATGEVGAAYPECAPDLAEGVPSGGVCHGGMLAAALTGDYCGACLCHEECETDADCTASTGDAVPVCDGKCSLRCGHGETCPDGMTCVEIGGGNPDECMWPTSDPFVCAGPGFGEAPCTGISDEATCNALVSPGEHGKCQWFEAEIHSDSSCLPAGGTGTCVLVRPSDGCELEASCSASGPTPYWRDLGAGTYTLITVEDCEWEPDESEGYQGCSFSGDVATPILCGCGCE